MGMVLSSHRVRVDRSSSRGYEGLLVSRALSTASMVVTVVSSTGEIVGVGQGLFATRWCVAVNSTVHRLIQLIKTI